MSVFFMATSFRHQGLDIPDPATNCQNSGFYLSIFGNNNKLIRIRHPALFYLVPYSCYRQKGSRGGRSGGSGHCHKSKNKINIKNLPSYYLKFKFFSLGKFKSVFRIRMDPGFFADPDPDFRNPDPDLSINKQMGSKW